MELKKFEVIKKIHLIAEKYCTVIASSEKEALLIAKFNNKWNEGRSNKEIKEEYEMEEEKDAQLDFFNKVYNKE